MKIKLMTTKPLKASRSNLPQWIVTARVQMKQAMDTIGIAGQGFIETLPKKNLPFGDACVHSSIFQQDVLLAKIAVFFVLHDHAMVAAIHCLYKMLPVEQKKYLIHTQEDLKKCLFSAALAIKTAIERERAGLPIVDPTVTEKEKVVDAPVVPDVPVVEVAKVEVRDDQAQAGV